MFSLLTIWSAYWILAIYFKSIKEAFWSFEFYFVVANIFMVWAFYDYSVWFQIRFELLMLGILTENLNG